LFKREFIMNRLIFKMIGCLYLLHQMAASHMLNYLLPHGIVSFLTLALLPNGFFDSVSTPEESVLGNPNM